MESYNPTFWLPFSLIKSAYLGRSQSTYLNDYRRHRFRFKDGSIVSLDVHPRTMKESKQVPTILIVPGIFTESGDHQIRSLVKYVYRKLGWRSVVFNRVGFSGMELEGKLLSSFDCYEEFHNIVLHVKNKYPKCPLYSFGASLGSAFIQRYLQEFPGHKLIEAVACVSSPWNTTLAAENFHNNPILRLVILYVQRQIFLSHIHEQRMVEILAKHNITPDDMINRSTSCRDLWDINSLVQGITYDEFESNIDSHREIEKIGVPMLTINSVDD